MLLSPGARSAWPALALATAFVVAAGPAAAAPLSAELSVTRAAGAEDCPDREALGRIIARIVGGGGLLRPGGEVRADVQFARAPAGYQAALRLAGAKEGERTLTDTAPTCTALGRAVGITMALLLDARLDAPPEAPPPVVVAALAPAPLPPAPGATRGFLSVTAGPALGLVGAPSLAAGLGFELRVRHRLWLEADGQYVAPRATAYDTGNVDVGLVAGRLRACGALGDGAVQLAPCAAVAGGRLSGQGRGFASGNTAATLEWWGVGAGLQVSGVVAGRWLVGVGADVLAPLRKSSFSIGNRGAAFQSGPVSLLLLASIGIEVW